MADAMVSGGWRDAGYTYLSLDDCWQATERAPNGSIVPDATRFPSGMKALGDYIHSRGLRFGMYTAMGDESCSGYPAFGCATVEGGGCEQARRDVQTYVSWGIDYIKVDSCRNATGGPMDGSQFNTTHPLVSSFFLQAGKVHTHTPSSPARPQPVPPHLPRPPRPPFPIYPIRDIIGSSARSSF
jgi:alpha-galactosidase